MKNCHLIFFIVTHEKHSYWTFWKKRILQKNRNIHFFLNRKFSQNVLRNVSFLGRRCIVCIFLNDLHKMLPPLKQLTFFSIFLALSGAGKSESKRFETKYSTFVFVQSSAHGVPEFNLSWFSKKKKKQIFFLFFKKKKCEKISQKMLTLKSVIID